MGLAFVLLDGPVVSALGCCYGGSRFKAPGSKTPIKSTALALAVFSLPVQPYDAVHSLKKLHETGQVC